MNSTDEDFHLFVSYARSDLQRLTRLEDLFQRERLKVWIDHCEIPSFAVLREQIERGLARSRAVLVCYSATYPRRHWCMAELAAVLTVVYQRAELRQRLFVLNLEPGVDHILPHSLRDSLIPALLDNDDPGLARLCADIAQRTRALDGVLGAVALAGIPRWFGPPRYSSTRFTGRESELWSIHEALSHVDRLGSPQAPSHGVCQVRGLGGLGKSLLAEEYALRFAAAWPAGIFWLEAPGDQLRREGGTTRIATGALETALRQIVHALDGNAQGMATADMRMFVAKYAENQPNVGLWIVDDLPIGLDAREVREWLSPHPRLRTLITTRSFEHGAIGRVIDLLPMSSQDSENLLSLDDAGNAGPQTRWAAGLAERLGWHPLALDVTRAALRAMSGVVNPEQFIERLASEDDDILALASELADELPNGHEKHIAATFIAGFEHLSDDARSLLQISALCAEAPIPTPLLLRLSAADEATGDRAVEARVLLAMKALERAALCVRDGEGSLLVHALISRSVRFRDRDSDRYRERANQLCEYLAQELSGFERYDELLRLGKLAPHARAVLRKTDGTRSSLFAALGDFEHTSGHFEEAARWQGAALSAMREALGMEHLEVLDLANRYALALTYSGQAAAAVEIYVEALAALRHMGLEQDPRTTLWKGNMAAALRGVNRLQEAVQIEREVLAWRLEHLGVANPLTLTSMHQLSVAEDLVGNGARALELEREAYQRREELLGPNHMHTLLSLQALAHLEYHQGAPTDAAHHAEENARRRIQLLGARHPYATSGIRVFMGLTGSMKLLDEYGLDYKDVFDEYTSASENNKAVLHIVQGRYREALAIINGLLASHDSSRTKDLLLLRHNRLAALVQLGRRDEAATLAKSLVADEEASLGADAQLTLQSRYYLALNTAPDAAAGEVVAALQGIAESMIERLPDANIPRIRCELELMLAKILADPASVTLAEATQLRERARKWADHVFAAFADCVAAVVGMRSDPSASPAELEAGVATLASRTGQRHPDVVRFLWLLCQLDHEQGRPSWRTRLDLLRWLAEDEGQLDRVTLRCLHQIRESDWSREAFALAPRRERPT